MKNILLILGLYCVLDINNEDDCTVYHSYFQVCDMVSDCQDNSDESLCVYDGHASHNLVSSPPEHIQQHLINSVGDCQRLVTRYPSLVNDLYPDCRDAEDEPQLLSLRRNDTAKCQHPDHQPCHAAVQGVCYPRHETCMYRENEMGLLSPCRNAGHLLNCWFHECPTMFKCPEAYCVPYQMLCDGINQCPHAHDEVNCTSMPYRPCAGMFRCKDSYICVHLSQLCDGIVDCTIRGEDENVCEKCPEGCTCSGLIIRLFASANAFYPSFKPHS